MTFLEQTVMMKLPLSGQKSLPVKQGRQSPSFPARSRQKRHASWHSADSSIALRKAFQYYFVCLQVSSCRAAASKVSRPYLQTAWTCLGRSRGCQSKCEDFGWERHSKKQAPRRNQAEALGRGMRFCRWWLWQKCVLAFWGILLTAIMRLPVITGSCGGDFLKHVK